MAQMEDQEYFCSECKTIVSKHYKECPNCGADLS